MLTLSIPLGSSARAPNLTSKLYPAKRIRQGLQNSAVR
ncbi:Uncharacterised protein [Serratia fonticola]|uniref:Uncharacterized protein n=1 Tax=Serratia fonticola TaxID=47917 RepID=A0A4U9UQN8_SERFO|nr:Uncharacterised protein [Serratia fonticola]